MGVGSNSRGTVNLVPGNLTMRQQMNLPLFEITRSNLDYNNNQDGLKVSIVLKRKFVSEIMTTYFPSFLLLAITVATTFFKPFFFEAALSVNLTTMLVMTTIYTSKIEEFPPTSDHICEHDEADKDKDKAGKTGRKELILSKEDHLVPGH